MVLIFLQRLLHAGVGKLPSEMAKELIEAAVKEKTKKESTVPRPFVNVPPKPRGMTGPISTSSSQPLTPSPSPYDEYTPHQPPPLAMPPWGGYYGAMPPIIIQSGTLDSPTKRALGVQQSGQTGPTRGYDYEDGPLLEEWLEELDRKVGRGQTPYGDLWPGLQANGFEYVRDIVLCSIPELSEAAGCTEVIARRIRSRACVALGIKQGN